MPIDDNLDEALRTARREFANAAELDRARSACDRAQQCVTRAEQELQRFAPLDPEISEWTAAQVRDDLDEPMPHHLLVAQGDRAAATDRLNHADRAQQRLAAGLRHCEANAQIAEKRLKAIARACLMVGAKAVAVELAEVQSRALSLQRQFMSLAQLSCPVGTVPPLPCRLPSSGRSTDRCHSASRPWSSSGRTGIVPWSPGPKPEHDRAGAQRRPGRRPAGSR